MKGYVQVVTTVPNAAEGADLARSIACERLAAGIQILGPIRSVYWWRGALQDATEWQLVILTTAEHFDDLERHIKANHTYETPEIIATDIVAGSAEYLRWITDETRKTDASS